MTTLSQDAAQAALGQVIDPTFEKDLATLGTLSAVAVDGAKVRCKISLSTPSDAIKEQVRAAAEAAVKALGAEFLEVEWEVKVPTRNTTGEMQLENIKNIILVMSGKGGVGKSTVATNLALALRRAGTRVGLLDADLYGPSIPTMLGVSGTPFSKDGKKIEPLERFGLKMMSIGFLLEDDKQAVIWRGPMLDGALRQFFNDVAWGELDYLVIDSPPGTGDIALTLAQRMRISGVLMVTTPQEVALQDVYKGVSLCQKLNLPILGVVENMSYFVDSAGVKQELFGAGGGEKVAEFAEAPLIGQVPIDMAVREWGDKGTPVVQAAPESAAGQAFAEVAGTLTEIIAKRAFEEGGGEKAPADAGPKRLRILR